jgi:hypothetical protein
MEPLPDPDLAPAITRTEWGVVLACAAALAVISLDYCYARGLLLLYGDAVAHLHIARRVLDSAEPGYRQLGSVWLPLPHLLLIPFVMKMSWWRTGLAGAWPSMACYVLACGGIYGLLRSFLRPAAAVLGLGFFGLNPGLLYFATTAMTEPLFLAEMIWAALLLLRLSSARREERRARTLLLGLGAVLACAVFTRYDGWIYASAVWCVATCAVWRGGNWRATLRQSLAGAWILFTAIVAVAPLLWMGYNARQFHDPLDFLRGPYSARAIEARTTPPGSYHYPGYHRVGVAELYFLKAAELGATARPFADVLLVVSIAGTIVAVRRSWSTRRVQAWALLLLWLPAPFYAYSVAYGSVPIFIPVWFPHSWYNTRYGMEMLPAFAVFPAFAVDWALQRWPRRARSIAGTAGALIAANALWLLAAGPLVFAEAVANSRTRIPFERALAGALDRLPATGRILMVTSDHIGALQDAGIPLRRTINEGDYYAWPPALQAPARSAAFVVALDGDAVANAVAHHPQGLELLDTICAPGQPCAHIYRSEPAGDRQ